VLAELAVDAGFKDEAGDGSSSSLTMGPTGQKVSNPLARDHWSSLLADRGGYVVGQGVAADGIAPVFRFEIVDAAADDQC